MVPGMVFPCEHKARPLEDASNVWGPFHMSPAVKDVRRNNAHHSTQYQASTEESPSRTRFEFKQVVGCGQAGQGKDGGIPHQLKKAVANHFLWVVVVLTKGSNENGSDNGCGLMAQPISHPVGNP
jgi:hypothetical protein